MQPKYRLRVFLDSNVIFSGLYSSAGAPGKILEWFMEGRLMMVISKQVLDEVVRTIKEKLPGALPALRKLLISTPPEVTKDPPLEEVTLWAKVIDAEDAAILAAAVASQPNYLITGDKHFFDNPDISEKSGLNIVTPAEFVKRLASSR
ncbi:MAG: putative toxin-antitoxin system toxin component, PIN family [Deltaproteobacteria bacterium]|nr:putative toxin-antitoxin system toxin component, PIN family [Deltaproteobacteria bacterium]